MVTELKKEYKEVLGKEKRPYVLELYATWCGVCKQMMPIYDAVSADDQNKGYGFYRANVDELMEIAKAHNVMQVPTFLFFKGGKEITTHVGYITKDDFNAKLKEVFEQ